MAETFQPVLAETFQSISSQLFFWKTYDPSIRTDLSSSAYLHKGDLVLIDPIRLEEKALAQLERKGSPKAIILTNGNHDRATEWYRSRYQIPVVASIEARQALDTYIDVILLPYESIYEFKPIALPGAGPGETAFLSSCGILFLGDAVIHLENPSRLDWLPDAYCEDKAKYRKSLHQLLEYDFQTLCFAHGPPLQNQAREQMEALLNSYEKKP